MASPRLRKSAFVSVGSIVPLTTTVAGRIDGSFKHRAHASMFRRCEASISEDPGAKSRDRAAFAHGLFPRGVGYKSSDDSSAPVVVALDAWEFAAPHAAAASASAAARALCFMSKAVASGAPRRAPRACAEFERKDRVAAQRPPAHDAGMIRIDERAAWAAVTKRDRARDGEFVFAVKTTGIFCRPSCPARRPRRENVLFFATPDEAVAGGFRACKRCRPRAARSPADALVARARAWLDRAVAASDGPITLAALARELDVSPFHIQRSFKRAHGVSPRAYVDAARAARFAAGARAGRRVADAAQDAGYGSSRALYEGATRALGMTPGALRRRGEGERIAYTTADTGYGVMLVAESARGVVRVSLGDHEDDLVAALERDLSRATLVRDDVGLRDRVRAIVRVAEGAEADVPLDLRGTSLELRVWDALRKIPRGTTTSYGELARAIGEGRAVRAVARACGANPVALVVPCHRVVAKDGALTGYRWGLDRKKRILEAEAADHFGVQVASPTR